MTTSALRLPPRIARLPQLRQIVRGGLAARGSIGAGLAAKAGGAAATPWYLAGGAPTPVAVYQPKGAVSLAASYVNLVSPGTYDAAPGIAPTFDAAAGWRFAEASHQYLLTGIAPANTQTWSYLARYSDHGPASYAGPIGNATSGGQNIAILETRRISSNKRAYFHGTTYALNGGDYAFSGVIALAGRQGYFDGLPDGSLLAVGAAGITPPLLIAALDNGAFTVDMKIQAIVIYSDTLTASQVLAVSTAMAAL